MVLKIRQIGRIELKNKLRSFLVALLFLPLAVWAACFSPQPFDESRVSVVNTSLSYGQGERTSFITTIGSISNTSDALIEDIVVEVKYFNAKKKLIDVVTQPIYGLVVPPSQEVAFRVRDVADKSKVSYASSAVRIVSANQRVTQQPQPKSSSNYGIDFFASWGPMLLLIAVWIYFMRKANRKDSPQVRTIDLIEKQNAVLDRIAAAAEKASDNHT